MYSEYKKVCKTLKENCILSDYTTFGIGGRAKLLAFPENLEEFVGVLNLTDVRGDAFVVLGGGSNVLISDGGFDGVVIMTRKLNRFSLNGEIITAECGTRLSTLSLFAKESSLTGLEFGCGIPGTIGGVVRMNAGAYGQSIGESVVSVTLWDRGEVEEVQPSFTYRKSNISTTCVILSVKLGLVSSNILEIEARMKGMKEARANSQPTMKSAGCIFLSDDGVSAGYYIEKSGLKGTKCGGAEISDKHAGFIVNRGNATAMDVIRLINIAKESVKSKFGKNLTAEIRFIGDFDEPLR